MPWLRVEAGLIPIRKDPRFAALVKRIAAKP